MDEVIALENEIMEALPAADRAAGMMDDGASIDTVIRYAHDILCNGWCGAGGQRLDRLRTIARELRRFA